MCPFTSNTSGIVPFLSGLGALKWGDAIALSVCQFAYK